MGCCQSNNEDNVNLIERKQLQSQNVSFDCKNNNYGDDDDDDNTSQKAFSDSDINIFPGYEKILQDRDRMVSYNSNGLISGYIDVNFINQPKMDFFNNYQIGKFLGQGGFGTVFMATHIVTKVKRAIKMVSKTTLSQQDKQILLEELSILKEIDHPNILKILEYYEDDQHHFFVTEFLSGGELFNKISDLNGFDENKASEYMRQILSAVTYCHSRNIVHRDLKPENILFETKRESSQIKVIDFGCSTKFDRTKKIQDIAGTVLYLAPEVLKKDAYDEKCDIWALGVVLFIMLSGIPPFDAPTDEELFDRIQNQPLSFLGEGWPSASNEAKDLISKMLDKDPQRRISAQEAYQHPWIQMRIQNTKLQSGIMHNLAQFSARNKVKTAILNMITLHILSNKDKQEIVRNFQRLDLNGDGQLSREELIDGYENILGDRAQAIKVVEKVFKELDYDGSGLVSFQEFLVASLSKEKMFSKENLLKAFDLIDEDRNGFITKEELQRLVGGTPIDDQVWERMMKECDTNGDGQVRLDKVEFVDLLLKWLERDLFKVDEPILLCSQILDQSDPIFRDPQAVFLRHSKSLMKREQLSNLSNHSPKKQQLNKSFSVARYQKQSYLGNVLFSQSPINSTNYINNFSSSRTKFHKTQLSQGNLRFAPQKKQQLSYRQHSNSILLAGMQSQHASSPDILVQFHQFPDTESSQQILKQSIKQHENLAESERFGDIFVPQQNYIGTNPFFKISFKENDFKDEEQTEESEAQMAEHDGDDIPCRLNPSFVHARGEIN